MGEKDYYGILGVGKDATDEELRKQYRKLSMQYHPDRQAGKSDAEKKAAEDRFKEINEAYSVLSDKEKRARYDRFGDSESGGFDFDGIDPMEFFRKMHRSGFGFDDGEGDYGFGQKRRKPTKEDLNRPEDGNDISLQMRVSFKESVFGCTKEFDLDLDKECPECGGTGAAEGAEPKECEDCHGSGYVTHTVRQGWMVSQSMMQCQKCGGTGFTVDRCGKCHGAKRVYEKRHVKVRVPAGFQDGMRLRLKGMGQSGVKGGSNGSLYLTVRTGQSDVFMRDGNDIYIKTYISPVVASLGGKVEVPTLYGYKKVKIAPGTANGTRLRVAGEGVKPEVGERGDMIIELEVEPYSSVTDEQKELLEKLQKSEGIDNFKKASELRKKAEEFYS